LPRGVWSEKKERFVFGRIDELTARIEALEAVVGIRDVSSSFPRPEGRERAQGGASACPHTTAGRPLGERA
jgi:hypothetical protein